jgi:hypothetical protein
MLNILASGGTNGPHPPYPEQSWTSCSCIAVKSGLRSLLPVLQYTKSYPPNPHWINTGENKLQKAEEI